MTSKKEKTKPIRFEIGWLGVMAIVVAAVVVLLWTFVLGFWMGQKVFTGCEATKENGTAVVANAKPSAGHQVKEPSAGGEVIPEEEPGLFDENAKAIEDLKEKLKHENMGGEEGTVATEVLTPDGQVNTSETTGKSGAHKALAPVAAPVAPSATAETVKEVKKHVPKKEQAASHKITSSPHKKTVAKHQASQKLPKDYFSLQIASFKNSEQAIHEAARWNKKGYSARVKKVNLVNRGTWYRVYLGKYASLAQAQKAASRLASKEGIRSYVVKGSR